MGLGFFLSGMLAPAIHTPYVNIGMPFLFCLAASECHIEKRWWKLFFMSFLIFVLLNVFYIVTGMSGSGLIRGLIYG